MNYVFRPGAAAGSDRLGGKAGALATLHGRGPCIPEWFALLPQAFEDSLSRDDAGSGPVPVRLAPAVLRELEEALAILCPAGEPVAVRSSAPGEDGRDHSFAGQLESFLCVPTDEVSSRVLAVWNSAFGERVLAYRARHRIPGTPKPPAVLIQRMVRATASGVAFGADPVTGRPDLAVVAAVEGLGTALVNGERDADTWHVEGSGGVVRRQPAGPGGAGSPVLDDAQVRAVAALARRTGEIFGCPQDIEWAIGDGRLQLLQSRPITPTARRGAMAIWDNSNIVESYSGVTLPLTFSFARRAYTGVYRQFCRMLAVPGDRIAAHEDTFRHMLGLVRGRVYYNLLNWYRVLALLPGFTLNRRFMEQMMGVKEELPAEILAGLGSAGIGDRLKDGFDVVRSVAALAANHHLLPWKIRRFHQRLDDALAPPPRPLESMTAEELSAHFAGLERKLLTRWDAPLLNDFFAMIFYGVLRRLTAKWVGDAEGTLQNDLLCGEGGMISVINGSKTVRIQRFRIHHGFGWPRGAAWDSGRQAGKGREQTSAPS